MYGNSYMYHICWVQNNNDELWTFAHIFLMEKAVAIKNSLFLLKKEDTDWIIFDFVNRFGYQNNYYLYFIMNINKDTLVE